MCRGDVIGCRLWDYSTPSDAAVIQRHFSECLLHGTEPEYEAASVSRHGAVERWGCRLLPCSGAEIIAVSHEVFADSRVEQIPPEDRRLLGFLCDDMPVEDIAMELACPPSTIASRLRRLRERCGVRTNHGLVAWFLLRAGG